MQQYVATFALTGRADAQKVLLIKKNRPAWQKGKLNAIGGKVEPGELSYQAMCREFWEETGLKTGDFHPLCVLGDGLTYEVYFYYTYLSPAEIDATQSMTDEKIGLFDVEAILTGKFKTISNLPWLLAMALEKPDDGPKEYFHYKITREQWHYRGSVPHTEW
jgi:8-oxo-dGTP diphosphatase